MGFVKKFVLLFVCCWLSSLCARGEQFVLTPQWTAQAQFAGYYVAVAKGFYKRAGLDVKIEHISASNSCVNRLKDGTSQFVTMHLLSAIKYMDEGLRLVNVMQASQNSSLMIISKKPLEGPKDLQGMRIGNWKMGFSELGFILDKEYGLNIQWIPFIQNINLFISGAIDATMAMSYNEYYQLLMSGRRLKENQLLYFSKIGYNIPEDGVYVTEEFYKTHKKDIEKFVAATRQGWEWACAHPQETLDFVMDAAKKTKVKTNRKAQEWMLEKILDTLVSKRNGKRTYTLDERDFNLAVRLLHTNGYISNKIAYKQIKGS